MVEWTNKAKQIFSTEVCADFYQFDGPLGDIDDPFSHDSIKAKDSLVHNLVMQNGGFLIDECDRERFSLWGLLVLFDDNTEILIGNFCESYRWVTDENRVTAFAWIVPRGVPWLADLPESVRRVVT